MRRHLLMRLRAPLVAFGGESIDNYGVIRDFPAMSMITGLIANALGWDRGDSERHDRLQARLVMGARLDRSGERLPDFQTAQLGAKDSGWTTLGHSESRQGGADTYKSPHLRYRDYHAGLDALIALRLDPANEAPTLDDIARALDRPMRPLFIGRKPCLPSARVFAGFIDAGDVLDALRRAPLPEGLDDDAFSMQWPTNEGAMPDATAQAHDICDERNWTSGVHGGSRPVLEVSAKRTSFAYPSTCPEFPYDRA
ncbi:MULTISPECIES: type I-E CRISPR-associated protein Cas5/CasD [unclassified Caballeronia]|uniref:type I-E CRISPR-associated protein Cas5/CasD n=1 Tax=unclassified Caballeronia TaxID=2646786 RepID=UPI002867A025|nr:MULTISPECIES: type I-E CRISPR-associated protein Cas5/CasD [unclassified Caballeronia]MDR5739026.1 type I-E CRISPR-associated protein Cas5/CasD [Caballeronia sp. LZ016]MDR5807514.1 type I-E CRISPR-associated protein Cas5/CasD [Caballeronia sp. LZ019]